MKQGILMAMCFLVMLVTSCEKVDFSEVEVQEKNRNLEIYTRASDTDALQYPLVVFVFDAKGQCRGQQTLLEDGSTFSFQLPSGSYRIVALGGISSCDLPSTPKLSSCLTLKENATVPLQMGQADVTMGQNSTKAYLQMRYLVSQVRVSLSGLPSDVTSVSMVLSKPYSQWAFSGTGSTPTSYTKTLKPGSLPGIWETGDVYVLPTEGPATLTLNLATPTGNVSYAYTCPEALRSGVPYLLNGSYSTGDMVVEGEFSVEGWAETVNWDFGFGPSVSVPDVNEPSGAPIVGTLWRNHIVAYVSELNETQWSVYLLSREEKVEVPSALSGENSDMALQYAQGYVEDGVSGWSIPTSTEVRKLQESFGGDALVGLNMMLTQEGLSPFLDYEPNSSTEKARYLCDEGVKSFSMANNSRISDVSGTKKYRLRLVKEIIVDK
ncbi:MAG: FimB/Mfa2 family fimbrial subunit [Bacteroidaceae bacterium]|nr:FimB/Mfa2 family fimbrial subunit [Bacteroidaceae bacterium]